MMILRKTLINEFKCILFFLVVGIATGYGLEFPGSIPGMANFFSSPEISDGPHVQWIPETISLGVKRPGHEANYSPPSSAEVKNSGAIPPLPHMSSWHSV
jgi:hypothetical protein